ncbi:hypothetical protein KY285_030874 [Solanum tuberosum]|nr:hypothetical protein KY285_030874 [Solanum tuberosum]
MLSSTFGSFMQWISVAGGGIHSPFLCSKFNLDLLYSTKETEDECLTLDIGCLFIRYVLRLLSGATIGSGNFLYRTTTTRERIKQYCFVLMISAIASILLDSNNTDLWIHTQQTFFMEFLVIYSKDILYDANFGDINFVNCMFTTFYHLPGIVIHAATLYQ